MMKFRLKNLWKAPVATLIAICVLCVFVGMRVGKFIESADFVALSTITIPLAFSDPFSETKKGKEDTESEETKSES